MKNLKILIVEDEALSVMFLKMVLKKAGHHVEKVVASGEEAIEYAVAEGPDLILMDISLAGSIDGIEAALTIKNKVDVQIIFMTGYPDRKHMTRAKEADPVKYFIKPIETSDFITAVNAVCQDPDKIEHKL